MNATVLDGVRIAFEVQGAGEPLLLVQGLGYGRSGWGPARELLAERLQVVSYDSRGFGESDTPPGPYTTAQLAEDAVGVLDAAERRARSRGRHQPRRDGRAGARAAEPGPRAHARAVLDDARRRRRRFRCRR